MGNLGIFWYRQIHVAWHSNKGSCSRGDDVTSSPDCFSRPREGPLSANFARFTPLSIPLHLLGMTMLLDLSLIWNISMDDSIDRTRSLGSFWNPLCLSLCMTCSSMQAPSTPLSHRTNTKTRPHRNLSVDNVSLDFIRWWNFLRLKLYDLRHIIILHFSVQRYRIETTGSYLSIKQGSCTISVYLRNAMSIWNSFFFQATLASGFYQFTVERLLHRICYRSSIALLETYSLDEYWWLQDC